MERKKEKSEEKCKQAKLFLWKAIFLSAMSLRKL